MKLVWMLVLCASCALAGAQTNLPPQKPVNQQKIWISSERGYFDGITNQMIYLGHVVVTDHVKATLNCERLTVDLPADGGHPTNIVAETNVVIDLIDGKGQTNHVTADKAVYAYHVINSVTNETVTFTGGDPLPKVENPQAIITGEPLVLDVVAKKFGGTRFNTILKSSSGAASGTNASPFNFLQ